MRVEMHAPILILGASARAAAQSARRAGLVCNAIDLFADVDLRAACETVIQADSYPMDLAALAERLPPGPWLYTGALENYPDLIATISAARPLLGNGASALEVIRNPVQVACALAAARQRTPLCSLSPDNIPRDGTWLCKSLRSAGGLRIEPWLLATTPVAEREYYWQQRIAGVSCGAVFLATAGRAMLLGVSQALLGPEWGAPRPFQYAGSIGPLPCSPTERQQWESLGNTLAAAASLQGLFGVDAIVNENGIYPIEVNPRLTASTELLERAGDFSAVGLHCQACVEQNLPPLPANLAKSHQTLYGKLIVFATSDIVTPAGFAAELGSWNGDSIWPQVADIPPDGTAISAGQPIATVFAASLTLAAINTDLRRQASALLVRAVT